MGNVQMEAEQIRYKGSTYKNMQTAMDAALGGGGGSSTLAGLTDTDITTPSNGQVLTYDSTAEKWENAAIPAQSLVGLSDTTITEPSNGQVLTYDSTAEKWENAAIPAQSLVGLSDTTITEPSNGQVLTYDGTAEKWVNASAGGGGGSGYTDTAIESHTFTGTSYEDIATVDIPAGIHHLIAGIYATNSLYPAPGIRLADGSFTMIEATGTGWNNPCVQAVINGGTSGKTIKIQAKGNAAGPAAGYYMMRKLADAPSNNESR